ncbi:hypothetical protein SDC9_161073 [bioreactor metagenome]|uniref:Uncharacterized protein n=1 Tax=bioreactor metagenome TaxID=1076179 RepID=A0A645FH75_9ZZZZ
MLANKATGITARRTCLSTETRAVSSITDRKLINTQNFTAVVIGYRHLGSWNQIVVHAFQFEHVFRELR